MGAIPATGEGGILMRRVYRLYQRFWLKPRLQKKLERPVRHQAYGFDIEITPGVFHPGYFHSTAFLIDTLIQEPIQGKTLLELGCGSGLLSLVTARQGAIVTAVDIHTKATASVEKHAAIYKLPIEVKHSDLFAALPKRVFDYIAINPPYYAKDPTSDAERAWYCGSRYEYFESLFNTLGTHIHANSKVLMVLSEDCHLAAIRAIADKHGIQLGVYHKRKRQGEYQIIYTCEVAAA